MNRLTLCSERFLWLICLLLWCAFLGAAQTENSQSEAIKSHLRQAQLYLKSQRPDLAITEYRAALAIDPNSVDAQANIGVVLFFEGKYGDAVPELRAALKSQPALWKLQALLGISEKRIGNLKLAQADLEASLPHLEEKKLKVQAGLELVEADYGSGELDKAASVIGSLKELDPANNEILYTAHRIYSELSDESMLSLAMLAPDSARMHQLMAHELARQGNIDGAIAHYRQALAREPNRADLHYELAEMLNTSSSAMRQQEAEREYKAALALNPSDEKSECRLGDVAMRRSELNSAFAHYSRALELQPNDVDANLGITKILMTRHEPAQAQQHLELAAALEPFNATTHYRLGVLYRELGREEDSRRELAQFEKLKKMKTRLGEIYQEMRLEPGGRKENADVTN